MTRAFQSFAETTILDFARHPYMEKRKREAPEATRFLKVFLTSQTPVISSACI